MAQILHNINVRGERALNRKLRQLATEGNSKLQRAGLAGAMTPLRKAIRAGVNSSSASTRLKRSARSAVGSSVKRNKGDVGYTAKAGLGVGKQTKKKKQQATERATRGGGVGIGARNIHWATLGTGERHHKSGHPTGQMPGFFAGVVQSAFSATKHVMVIEGGRKAKIALKKLTANRR